MHVKDIRQVKTGVFKYGLSEAQIKRLNEDIVLNIEQKTNIIATLYRKCFFHRISNIAKIKKRARVFCFINSIEYLRR